MKGETIQSKQVPCKHYSFSAFNILISSKMLMRRKVTTRFMIAFAQHNL